jgi:hypothetical protein
MLYSFTLFSEILMLLRFILEALWFVISPFVSLMFCSLVNRSMKISSQMLPADCEYLVFACYRGDSQISKCPMVFTWRSVSALCLLQWLLSGRAQVPMVWPHPGAVTLPSDTHVAVSQGNPSISLSSPFHFVNVTLVFKREILKLCYSIYIGYHRSLLTISWKRT